MHVLVLKSECANVIYRNVFSVLETSLWRFMIQIVWVISKGGSYLIIWGPPISINGTLSNNKLVTGTQKTAFCKKSVFLADRAQSKFFLYCRSVGPPDPLGLHAAGQVCFYVRQYMKYILHITLCVASTCECGNELSGSIICGEFG